MNKKTLSIFILGSIAAIALGLWLLREFPQETKINTKPPRTRPTAHRTPSESGLKFRYDPSLNPMTSVDAANDYYARREAMIRNFHGNEQIEKPLARVIAGNGTISELLTALGAIRRHETIEAVPYIVKLLNHDEISIRQEAVETLCFFGDHRGFEFIINECKKEDQFSKWQSLLGKVFTEYKPNSYNNDLVDLMKERNGPLMSQRVEAYELAKLLTRLGDPSGIDLIADTFVKYPPETSDNVLALMDLRHPLVLQIAKSLELHGLNDSVKQAADVVLAKQGDIEAQRRILEASKRVIQLLQPVNSDGSYKPGLKPTVLGDGAATPAWDSGAVFALEHGMETLPTEQAIPVLRDIAISADNVRFSRTAIELLAKIGNETARDALWETARSIQAKKRTFEDTIFTTTGKALMLYADPTSEALAKTMFSGDEHGMETSRLLAETRGWDGLFKLGLFY